jgi:hypothetical protein
MVDMLWAVRNLVYTGKTQPPWVKKVLIGAGAILLG